MIKIMALSGGGYELLNIDTLISYHHLDFLDFFLEHGGIAFHLSMI